MSTIFVVELAKFKQVLLNVEREQEKFGPQVLENSGGEEKKEGVSDSFWSEGYRVEIETISAI
ncbi:MAG: hypothetical protein G8237_09670 [Magnetococcales bacterium]|nr:hypothetical protein [Magnetococcales bacterium]NGZ06613.1 hypothetical protein [Magnetococcales bacterium]